MRYKYEAYDRTGNRVGGTVDAESPQGAEELLGRSELTVTKVTPAKKGFSLGGLLSSGTRWNDRQVVTWARQLSTLLEAGAGILRSLEVFQRQQAPRVVRIVNQDIIRTLQEGGRFSDALAKHDKVFPAVFVRLLRVGEETGDMTTMIRRAADHVEGLSAVKSKLKGSLTYPAIVAGTSMMSVYILITFTIPMLSDLMKEFEAELPFITKAVLFLGTFAKAWMLRGIVLFILVGAALYFYRRRPEGRARVDRLILRAPLIGGLMRKALVARTTQTIATAVESGVPLLEAVELTHDSMDNGVMRQALSRVRQDLLEGQSFAQGLSHSGVFPPLLVEMAAVGENSATLSNQLMTASKIYQAELDRAVASIIGLIEPLMIIVVGLVVGVIGVTVITTVYSILPNVGK